jgi:hypothetical protein
MKMGPIGFPENSVRNCQSTLSETSKGRRPHIHRGGNLKSRFILNLQHNLSVIIIFYVACYGNSTAGIELLLKFHTINTQNRSRTYFNGWKPPCKTFFCHLLEYYRDIISYDFLLFPRSAFSQRFIHIDSHIKVHIDIM